MTFHHLINIEKETDELKASVSEFDIEISCHFTRNKTSLMTNKSQTLKNGRSISNATRSFRRIFISSQTT